MIKILIIFGTRPEVIKLAPVISKINKNKLFRLTICVTAQHRQMIDPLLKVFNIKPDYDLDLMRENQSLEYLTTTVLVKITKIINKVKPDWVVVQGDTTTAMAASLAAFYQKVKIAHIEAGLRSFDKFQPYPEEINRRIIDSVSDLYFAHTKEAETNLLKEGFTQNRIFITGNTVIDSLLAIAERKYNDKTRIFEKIPFNKKKIILVTLHRRESFGVQIRNTCQAVKIIAKRFQKEVFIVFPVHLNPNVRPTVRSILKNIKNIKLTEPLEYEPFVQLMKKTHLILTDSGGIQEEAPSLHVPVLVIRKVTERPEVIKAGGAQLVGTNTVNIIDNVTRLLTDRDRYKKMSNIRNPYGDGKASQRIVKYLADFDAKEKT